MHDVIGLREPPGEISAEVVRRLGAIYRTKLPLVDGAVAAVERMAARWPLGLASSSNRELIDLVLDLAGLAPCFRATVSSEEVERGKPAPDVYLEAARRLGADPAACAAVEDSRNGILSAKAAGMRVVAFPNPRYPPDAEVLAAADAVIDSLSALDPRVVTAEARPRSFLILSPPSVEAGLPRPRRPLLRRGYSARPMRTQALWPPRPIAFDSATRTSASRASFGT
jgi:HAD superfamily hydrolase (TIGR01509 family)